MAAQPSPPGAFASAVSAAGAQTPQNALIAIADAAETLLRNPIIQGVPITRPHCAQAGHSPSAVGIVP